MSFQDSLIGDVKPPSSTYCSDYPISTLGFKFPGHEYIRITYHDKCLNSPCEKFAEKNKAVGGIFSWSIFTSSRKKFFLHKFFFQCCLRSTSINTAIESYPI